MNEEDEPVELDFDHYYAIIKDEVRDLGCTEFPDEDTAKNDYFLGIGPMDSAALFVKQWRLTEE